MHVFNKTVGHPYFVPDRTECRVVSVEMCRHADTYTHTHTHTHTNVHTKAEQWHMK